jgi:hypothetical protein
MATLSPVRPSDHVFVGEAKTLRWTITDAAGAVANVTGWTTLWNLEPQQGTSPVLTHAGVVADGPNGIITVTLLAAETSALTGGTYFHHLDRTDPTFEGVLSAGPFALQAR